MTRSPRTIESAHSRIEAHEDLCAERYRNIHETLSELKDGQKWVHRGMVAVLLAFVAWAGGQMWGTVQPKAEAHVTAIVGQK